MSAKATARNERYREHVTTEREAAFLYRGLAELSRGRRREVLDELAAIEDKHAEFWSQLLLETGETPPSPAGFTPSDRTRSLLENARRYSVDMVLPVVEQAERDAVDDYATEPEAPRSMLLEEAEHARILGELIDQDSDDEGETWHRSNKSGTLRAAIFGVNDGLISNTALVMGFAGAAAPRGTVLLAGFAGLLAGAFSMAAGEYISMANQREAFEREIALEAEEIAMHPEDEQRELELIYEAKGLEPEMAAQIAARVMADKEVALDTMVREELGLDPDDLGSPWGAAGSSFCSFALGAVVVVLPYLFFSGGLALALAVGVAVLALAGVGAFMARLNGRPLVTAVARQVAVGVVAAGATFALGALLGVRLD